MDLTDLFIIRAHPRHPCNPCSITILPTWDGYHLICTHAFSFGTACQAVQQLSSHQ